MTGSTVTLSPLDRADGSAAYTCPYTGLNILGSVNGPIELPGRRDAQKPEEATLEILVRPATAPSAVGERYAEGILKSVLGRIILGREKGFPRRGLVLTLVVLGGPTEELMGRGQSYIPVLPALLHTALLTLLSAAIPLSMTLTTTALAVTATGEIVENPSVQVIKDAASLHALAFSSKGHLLMNESSGCFDLDTWEKVHDRAYTICRDRKPSDKDGNLERVLRETVEDKIYRDYAYVINAA